MENTQMVLTAVALKAHSYAKDTMINALGTMLLEKEIKIEEWEASKRAGVTISINHGNSVETLTWEIKPTKK